MTTNELYCGNAAEVLRTLPCDFVQTCVTSPPYFGLRDYGVAGQIGAERSVASYVSKIVAVFREVRRVLRPDGTLWLNLGDSYATRSGSQPPTNTRNSCGHTEKHVPSGYKYKDLIGIPWEVAFALRADGWYLRQDIIWHKPNCMPESVRDRCTRSHEYIFLLTKSQKYYFDAKSICEPVADSTIKRVSQDVQNQLGSCRIPHHPKPMKAVSNGRTRNKRSVWTIPTNGYSGAHFATFPQKLVEPCVLAGSFAGSTVLDPFVGSGTTGIVALRHDRNFVGIDINPAYVQLSQERIEKSKEEKVT